MQDTELDLLARQLAEGLRGEHDAFCRALVQLLAGGYPVTPERLAGALQMTVEQVAEVLTGLADLEVDPSGNVVGWGLTFIPTPHRFRMNGQTFYTWCALDALTYRALLQLTEGVESSCPVSGTKVSLSVTPEGIHDLTPPSSVVALVIPEKGKACDCGRGSFCNQSLFFCARRDALLWQASSPTARLLSVVDAFQVGLLIARYRYPSLREDLRQNRKVADARHPATSHRSSGHSETGALSA